MISFLWIIAGFVVCVSGKFYYDDAMVDDVMAESSTNISVGCPGITINTFVIQLEWRCSGQCGQKESSPDRALIRFTKGSGISLLDGSSRIRLDSEMYALQFDPVKAIDTGKYVCLINNRPVPDAVINLNILDVPDAPKRPIVMGFTSRAVSLSWSKPRSKKDSPIIGYIINIGYRPVSAADDVEFMDFGREVRVNSSTPRYTVTGLLPYTVYNFKISSVNHVGISQPSKESYPTITLMEKPSGKPRVTAAHNTSSTTLYLSWQSPDPATVHGQFLGFIISYRPRDVSQDQAVEIPLENPLATEYTLTGLKIYTQYLVSIRVFNPEGRGPETIVVVMTDEGAPSPPRNIRVLSVTKNTIQISWWEPARANGILQGYRIYFLQSNFTSVQTIRDNKSSMVETLTRLKPYSEYKIWIKAYTAKNEGKSSEALRVTTDVDIPGMPIIVNLTCQNGNTMFLKWLRPKIFFRTVDVYHVYYRREDATGWEKQIVETVNNTVNHMMYLNNLTSNKVYDLKIQAGTRSLLGEKKMYFGDFSDTRRLLLQPGCEVMRTFSPSRSPSERDSLILINLEEHLGMIAGVVCGSLGLLLAVFAFLLWRRYTQDNGLYYPQDKYYGHGPTVELPGWDNASTAEGEHAVPAHLFSKHVAELHLDQDVGFAKEYEEVRAAGCLDEYTAQDSQLVDNQDKNRYPNIVAYDHTRVRLRNKGQEKDEYINANFTDGFRLPRAYIATQGPISGKTFNAFWRMIWEQNSQVIVMITNLFENGKPKCDMYWPDAGSETYEDLVVTLIRQDVLSHYTLRTFSIRNLRATKKEISSGIAERTVYQYHYTAWPDHGVPFHALPLISYIRNSVNANASERGPIVVHCSAGVGRTGCYIVLDAMMRQIESRGDVNIFSFLKHIRSQRNHLVQTEEQYIFIHDALVEAIEAGETHINKTNLPRYIHSLQCIDVTDEKNHPPKLLEKQYKLVTSYHPGKSEYSSALKICNQCKNRSTDLLASDSSRVYLDPTEIDGSDYINASWIPGFFDLREFIVSQHPLENTVMSFWKMVWEQETRLVVLLSSIDAQECRPFWPVTDEEPYLWQINGYQQMRLSVIDEIDTASRKTLRVSLELIEVESVSGGIASLSREIGIIHAPNWPQQCSPLSTVFDLIKACDEELRKIPTTSTTVVVDRHGGSSAGTFCCLKSLWHQLHFEGGVDVFQLAKLYHFSRPGIWRSQDDYLFMYCALEAYVTNNGTTIPSPVDIDQWKNGYQLNGCVRVSRVYTDSVTKVLNEHGMTESLRVPPDGQESASLLRHAEHGVFCAPSTTSTSSTCSTAGIS